MVIVRNNVIPFRGYKAVTLWPFIFARVELDATDMNHERIHGRQQAEMLLVGIVLAAVLALSGAGWWSLLALPLFFLLYAVEWVIWLFVLREAHLSYRCISFEREAYEHEGKDDYLKHRGFFSSIKYLG